MYTWQKVTALNAFLILCIFGYNDTEWRTYYITPLSNGSLIGCPFDHCYSLQDLFDNQSHFFASNTTLELLPGRHDIAESVGHLIITNVSNFSLKGRSGLSNRNTTINCQPGVTFGLTFTLCHSIEISNIHFNHCSADLNSLSFFNSTATGYDYYSLPQYLNESFIFCHPKPKYTQFEYRPTYVFLVSFRNANMTVYHVTIAHAKGVGFCAYGDSVLDISESSLEHNEMNCIIFVSGNSATNTSLSLSETSITLGWLHSFVDFSSGLNLFVDVDSEEHNISITNITLANNVSPKAYGNFYLHVFCVNHSKYTNLNLNILVDCLTSIQKEESLPGMVVKYTVNLEKEQNTRDSLTSCDKSTFSPIFDSWLIHYILCSNRLGNSTPQLSYEYNRNVNITLQNIDFIGSCVEIKNSNVKMSDGEMIFKMSNVHMIDSMCSTALTITNSDTSYIKLSSVTIINSRNNALSVLDTTGPGTLVVSGNTVIASNQGSVLVMSGRVKFKGFVQFSSNTANQYESLLLITGSSRVSFQGETIFTNNTGRQGGAISVHGSSTVEFEGNASFVGNKADDGGAISLKERARINLDYCAQIVFLENRARTYGGAIYVEDDGYWIGKNNFLITCFIDVYNTNDCLYHVEFENNTAGVAGAALFGGWIDYCQMSVRSNVQTTTYLEFKSENSVSSNPSRVCICRNTTISRYETEVHINAFPGQTLEIEAVAVGQRFGVVPATVRAERGSKMNLTESLQRLQDTHKECTKLKYTIRSASRMETLLLSVDRQNVPQNVTIAEELLQLRLLIHLNDCPYGYVFDKKQNTCLCQLYLLSRGVQCNFSLYTVNRNAEQWIGLMPPTMNIVIHNHCPYDYCKSSALSLNLSISDEQCSFSRSGILCGRCQPGLSQVLGTSNCKRCSNWWLLLTLVFVLAGVALVAGLMLLNITVSTGTINGLIFYANIVRVNGAVFFPGERANTFLSLFIAWLNLDLGIETCFYDGLDAYAKTWLQLAFPIYIWFLVTFIIISSRYSTRVARLCRKNAVQVLATLFLLSYAKLLRVTITVFQPTCLLETHRVWHYDGNIAYLGKRHAPLMFTALLLFVVFFIPYTIILFAIQWLQPFSHYKVFCWINQFKPLFDAYTGPYKDNHRYWTGLLLLVRIALFTVFSTNTSGDPAINLLAITVTIVCLFAYLALFAGVYKVCLLNILEYSFLLNLIILSVGVLYATSVNNKPVHVVTQISIAITLSVTLVIIAYHMFNMIIKLLEAHTNIKISTILKNKAANNLANNDGPKECVITELDRQVTHSVVELTEPLIN